jgi:hypothetical protein
LEAINAHLGTQFTVDNSWEEIFVEAASIANGESTATGNGEEWPSDDSEDDDYDPEKQETINATTSSVIKMYYGFIDLLIFVLDLGDTTIFLYRER